MFPSGSDNKLQTFLKMSDEEQRNVFTIVRSLKVITFTERSS